MGLLNIISNEVKAAIGYQQNFADLLTAKDVTRALSCLLYTSDSHSSENDEIKDETEVENEM